MKIPVTDARNVFLDVCKFMTKNERVQLPMFLNEPPKGKFFHDKNGDHLTEAYLLDKYKNV